MNTTMTSGNSYPTRWPPAYPRIETVEAFGEAATALASGDHRAGLLRALGNSWAAFFAELPPEKIRQIAEGVYKAATSPKSSMRTKLRAAEVIFKLLVQGTKVLADLAALAGPGKDAPASGNTVTIDLDASDAVQQVEQHLGVLKRMEKIKPVEVATGAARA